MDSCLQGVLRFHTRTGWRGIRIPKARPTFALSAQRPHTSFSTNSPAACHRCRNPLQSWCVPRSSETWRIWRQAISRNTAPSKCIQLANFMLVDLTQLHVLSLPQDTSSPLTRCPKGNMMMTGVTARHKLTLATKCTGIPPKARTLQAVGYVQSKRCGLQEWASPGSALLRPAEHAPGVRAQALRAPVQHPQQLFLSQMGQPPRGIREHGYHVRLCRQNAPLSAALIQPCLLNISTATLRYHHSTNIQCRD